VKKEISPVVTWVAIALAVIVVVFLGYHFIAGRPADEDKKGGDDALKRVQAGGKLYSPPANAPVPGNPGYSSSSAPLVGNPGFNSATGGGGGRSYNLTPPTR